MVGEIRSSKASAMTRPSFLAGCFFHVSSAANSTAWICPIPHFDTLFWTHWHKWIPSPGPHWSRRCPLNLFVLVSLQPLGG